MKKILLIPLELLHIILRHFAFFILRNDWIQEKKRRNDILKESSEFYNKFLETKKQYNELTDRIERFKKLINHYNKYKSENIDNIIFCKNEELVLISLAKAGYSTYYLVGLNGKHPTNDSRIIFKYSADSVHIIDLFQILINKAMVGFC